MQFHGKAADAHCLNVHGCTNAMPVKFVTINTLNRLLLSLSDITLQLLMKS